MRSSNKRPAALNLQSISVDELHQPIRVRADVATVDITVPVFNEERDLARCVERLMTYMTAHFPYSFALTIADNASTDSTYAIAQTLAETYEPVRVVHLDIKGRGNALREIWKTSESPILAYMDVDLSTDLNALEPLIASLVSGHSDVAIGTRLGRGSRVVRGSQREFISRSYNLLLRSVLQTTFSDAQCGFKAIRADVAKIVLPYTTDGAWFFDTELLVLAQRCQLRVHEIPVDWSDDPDSKVNITSTALADLRGMARISAEMVTGKIPIHELRAALARKPVPTNPEMKKNGLFVQLVRFGLVGIASTVLYLILFLIFRSGMNAQVANTIALLLSAIANTAVNRTFTFNSAGGGAVRHHLQGIIIFFLGWALTTVALYIVQNTYHPVLMQELMAVIGANVVVTVLKFLLFRWWVFRPSPTEKGTTLTEQELTPATANPRIPSASEAGAA